MENEIPNPIGRIPEEVLAIILGYLGRDDLLSCRDVSSYWRDTINNNVFFDHITLTDNSNRQFREAHSESRITSLAVNSYSAQSIPNNNLDLVRKLNVRLEEPSLAVMGQIGRECRLLRELTARLNVGPRGNFMDAATPPGDAFRRLIQLTLSTRSTTVLGNVDRQRMTRNVTALWRDFFLALNCGQLEGLDLENVTTTPTTIINSARLFQFLAGNPKLKNIRICDSYFRGRFARIFLRQPMMEHAGQLDPVTLDALCQLKPSQLEVTVANEDMPVWTRWISGLDALKTLKFRPYRPDVGLEGRLMEDVLLRNAATLVALDIQIVGEQRNLFFGTESVTIPFNARVLADAVNLQKLALCKAYSPETNREVDIVSLAWLPSSIRYLKLDGFNAQARDLTMMGRRLSMLKQVQVLNRNVFVPMDLFRAMFGRGNSELVKLYPVEGGVAIDPWEMNSEVDEILADRPIYETFSFSFTRHFMRLNGYTFQTIFDLDYF